MSDALFEAAVQPAVVGSGKQLFPQGGVPASLRLTGSASLDSGVRGPTYEPAGLD